MTELKVIIEKTELAKKLEHDINTKWDLEVKHPFDAGFDLRACIENPFFLKPGRYYAVPTGIKIQFDEPNWEAQVRPRSGLALKKGITVLNTPGTIDYMYRDEIQVILYNVSSDDIFISSGDRIAQLCFREIPNVKFIDGKVDQKDKRGGFGSTGIK